MAPCSFSRLYSRRFCQTVLDQRASIKSSLVRLAGNGWLRAIPLSSVHYPLCSGYRFESLIGEQPNASVTCSNDLAYSNKVA